MTKFLAIPFLVAASLPALAVATPVDNYAARDIANARYTSAITRLEADYARDPSDESILLNLALAYRYAGRSVEANRLYQQVLTMKDYELNALNGQPVWAHDVARRALTQQVAFRTR